MRRKRLPTRSHTSPIRILKSDGTGALTTAHRDAIMKRLNAGFSNTGFTFVHKATDTTADGVNGAVYACVDDQANLDFRSKKHQGGADSLNVVLCDTRDGSYITGFATLPPSVITWNVTIDGINLIAPSVNAYAPLDSQESIIHETAHWLGLLHSFTSPNEASGNVSWSPEDGH